MNEVRDRRALLETQVAQLAGRAAGRPAAAGGASGIGQTNLQLRLVQGQMRMLQAFDTMDRDQRGYVTTKSLFAILQSLNELPGRKTVIFFSEGLPSSPALRAHLRSVVESANRSNITVYAIDAAGLRAISGTTDTRREIEEAGKERMRQLQLGSLGEYTDQPMIRTIEKAEDMMRFDSQGGLAELSEDTGGFLVRDTNDLRQGVRAHRRGPALPLPADLLAEEPEVRRDVPQHLGQGLPAGHAGLRPQGLPGAALRADAARPGLRGAGPGRARRRAPLERVPVRHRRPELSRADAAGPVAAAGAPQDRRPHLRAGRRPRRPTTRRPPSSSASATARAVSSTR